MGFYFTTRFYSDVNDVDKYIELSSVNSIIDKEDMQQGYVSKQRLVNYYPIVKDAEFTNNSYLVEYCLCTLENPPSFAENKRLKVI